MPTIGTDNQALRHSYLWLGPVSLPLPPATFVAWGLFLAMWVPGLALSLAAFKLAGVIPASAWGFLCVVLVRRYRRKVTRDQPVRHHIAVLGAEITGPRPQPGTTTQARLAADLLKPGRNR